MDIRKPKQIIIESKSIPRSGLHFLKSSLEQDLGQHFSFCERYNEPGCCKSDPCALNCFLKDAKAHDEPHLRLIKSHDFQLEDKVPKSTFRSRTLILKRDPLFVITSLWELQEFNNHKELLKQHHIHVPKIFYLHERALTNQALQLIDANYTKTPIKKFQGWLEWMCDYMKKFQDKWFRDHYENEYTVLLDYEDVASYAQKMIHEVLDIPLLDSSNPLNNQSFTPREDPFQVKSKEISHFLNTHRDYILERLAAYELISKTH